MPRIVVIGSANMDMICRAGRLPKPGETVIGETFSTAPGGKGANQAVAAARLGVETYFIGAVGNDSFGEQLIESLTESGVSTEYVRRITEVSSGVALISVDQNSGENTIVVIPGANALMTPADIAAADDLIASASVIICSLEIPLDTVEAAIDSAHRHGVASILNPAPAVELPLTLIQQATYLTPNEHELAIIAGKLEPNDTDSASKLSRLGAGQLIVTMGANGVNIVGKTIVSAPHINNVVDTTAAGDCFNGAFAVALTQGCSVVGAAQYACAAASLSVTRAGAQPSLPTQKELDAFLKSAN